LPLIEVEGKEVLIMLTVMYNTKNKRSVATVRGKYDTLGGADAGWQ